jgi:IS605 OrfB family transposase
MSVRTIALTLKPTGDERAALEHLQRQFNAACGYISQVAWERREFNCIAKGIVQRAAESGRAIALEDLTHLRQRVRLKKSQRRAHSSWAYADLRAKIAYKACMAGVAVVLVDPRHTSQTCSRCGHCERANRQSQASFLCRQCGFAAHADCNAAVNIAVRGRAAVNLPYVLRSGVPSGAGTSSEPSGVGR